jgi:hypothetical protein
LLVSQSFYRAFHALVGTSYAGSLLDHQFLFAFLKREVIDTQKPR